MWQQKVKETNDAKYFRVHKSANTPKCDIVDTNPHASCAPGTTRTNNTAFLLYGSGLNKQKGGMHKKANGRIFNGFDLMCYAFLCRWVYVESLWDEKANGCKGKGFRTSFATLFLDFWLKVGVTSCNRLV